ncbi:hypothetical protein TNCV_1936071 [Trichonephila clavipes]|nr:hypothetical protein TNCV_1936071 [Trichonephila clavipes]
MITSSGEHPTTQTDADSGMGSPTARNIAPAGSEYAEMVRSNHCNSIISDRKSKEEQAPVTAESRLEFEKINLEKVKLEIELGKINLERAKLESQRDSNELQRTNPETKQTSIENFILSVRTFNSSDS